MVAEARSAVNPLRSQHLPLGEMVSRCFYIRRYRGWARSPSLGRTREAQVRMTPVPLSSEFHQLEVHGRTQLPASCPLERYSQPLSQSVRVNAEAHVRQRRAGVA